MFWCAVTRDLFSLYKDIPFKVIWAYKDEKGADYFRRYPSKDEIMGDDVKGLYDTITGTAGGGKSPEPKHVDVISQSARRN